MKNVVLVRHTCAWKSELKGLPQQHGTRTWTTAWNPDLEGVDGVFKVGGGAAGDGDDAPDLLQLRLVVRQVRQPGVGLLVLAGRPLRVDLGLQLAHLGRVEVLAGLVVRLELVHLLPCDSVST